MQLLKEKESWEAETKKIKTEREEWASEKKKMVYIANN